MVSGRASAEHVFLNRRGQPLTRFGIHALVERYAAQGGSEAAVSGEKRVSPHTIRHTTATHLLRAGVDINTIRAWLGHVSLSTTNVYAEVDLEMKAKALANCEVEEDNLRNPGVRRGADGVPENPVRDAHYVASSPRNSKTPQAWLDAT